MYKLINAVKFPRESGMLPVKLFAKSVLDKLIIQVSQIYQTSYKFRDCAAELICV